MGEIGNDESKRQLDRKRIDSKQHSRELREIKYELQGLRIHWGNEHIRLKTEAIRVGQKRGDARIVWKINEIKKTTHAKRKGPWSLKTRMGKHKAKSELTSKQ